jgi:hypothetical protein
VEASRRNSDERGADVGSPSLPTVAKPSAMPGREGEGDVRGRESDLSGDAGFESPVSNISRDSSSRGDSGRENLPQALVDEPTRILHENPDGGRKELRIESNGQGDRRWWRGETPGRRRRGAPGRG